MIGGFALPFIAYGLLNIAITPLIVLLPTAID